MKRLLLVFLATSMIVGFGVGSAFAADNMPSSKAAAAINALISLRADSSIDSWNDPDAASSTGWASILQTAIKTPNKKELAFDVALQCGLITDTTVRSKGGAKDGSEAEGAIRVRVKVTHPDGSVSYAAPANEFVDPFASTTGGSTQEGITYCDRFQLLEANFAGLNCWAAAYTVEGYCNGFVPATCFVDTCADGVTDCTTDGDCAETLGECTAGLVGNSCDANDDCDDLGGAVVDGVCRADGICIEGDVGATGCIADSNCDLTLGEGEVYCEDPEELRLVLKTLSAHAFNFLMVDVPPGVQTIEVEARADTDAALSGTMFGEAKSTALVGVGSMFIESVRMVKGAEADIITLD